MMMIGLISASVLYRNIEQCSSKFLNKYFASILLFQTIFCMPVSIYAYIFYPDWCWMYWVDSRQVGLVLVILVFLFYYFFTFICFYLGLKLEKIKFAASRKVLGLVILGFIIFAILTVRRLFYLGTVDQFASGQTKLLFLFPDVFPVVAVGLALAMAVLFIILVRFGREFDLKWSAEDQKKLDAKIKVVSLQKFNGDIKEILKKSLNDWNGLNYLKQLVKEKGPNIFIKPNFSGGGISRPGSQTSPEFLEAIIDLIKEEIPEANIHIAESGSILWKLETLMKKTKYNDLFQQKKVKFIHLGWNERRNFDFKSRMGIEPMPESLLQADIIIDAPVPKTHFFYKMSGALKNLLGLTPETHKLSRYHTKGLGDAEGRIFIDLYRNFTPDLVMVDGIISSEGYGPLGKPKRTNFVLTSDDAIATDLALANIMNFKMEKVPYLKLLKKEGLKCNYELVGAPLNAVKPPYWKHPDYLIIAGIVTSFRIITENIKFWFKK